MIKERMIELLVLGFILKNLDITKYDTTTGILKSDDGTNYNMDKILNRTKALIEEFLEPYVIESNSKE